ncbi:hypothetical protein LguiA_020473 [Lonicera macranthoides]
MKGMIWKRKIQSFPTNAYSLPIPTRKAHMTNSNSPSTKKLAKTKTLYSGLIYSHIKLIFRNICAW